MTLDGRIRIKCNIPIPEGGGELCKFNVGCVPRDTKKMVHWSQSGKRTDLVKREGLRN